MIFDFTLLWMFVGEQISSKSIPTSFSLLFDDCSVALISRLHMMSCGAWITSSSELRTSLPDTLQCVMYCMCQSSGTNIMKWVRVITLVHLWREHVWCFIHSWKTFVNILRFVVVYKHKNLLTTLFLMLFSHMSMLVSLPGLICPIDTKNND